MTLRWKVSVMILGESPISDLVVHVLIPHRSHYYKINDMLKLNPQHILHLYENTFGKAQVDSYVENVATNTENNYVWPSWFHNNGETLEETVERWLVEHNVDFLQMEQDIANGVIGVATSEQ